jgi:hypothetical protein
MDEFDLYWKNEVKPLAIKCCAGVELISALEKAVTDAEIDSIRKKMDSYNKKDWQAIYHISEMLFYVEHDLDHERSPIIGMTAVESCLNSEDYYKNVFCNQDCEEQKNYRTLGEKLKVAVDLWYKSHYNNILR